MGSVIPTCLGFPRIGGRRELKKALEAYWTDRSSGVELEQTARDLRKRHWQFMQTSGLELIPSNDFSLYDHMLDMAVALDVVPDRYRKIEDPLKRYFAIARGVQDPQRGIDIPALEMTKWFDTNYHYIVPELKLDQKFKLNPEKILSEVGEARNLGIQAKPVIPGPVTFLMLSKYPAEVMGKRSTLDLLESILPAYEELLISLSHAGVEWVQLDEPCLVLDLDEQAKASYRKSFARLSQLMQRPKLMLTTYFGALEDNLSLAIESKCEGLHIDLHRAPEQLATVISQLPAQTLLSLGLIDGRNIWRADLNKALATLKIAMHALGDRPVAISSSCSLLHVPVDLQSETKLDGELKAWLAFATQKVEEIVSLASVANIRQDHRHVFVDAQLAIGGRASSTRIHDPSVRAAVATIDDSMLRRSPFSERIEVQRRRFNLPGFPTTTIGSFPQTTDVREARAKWRSGKIPDADYNKFLREEIKLCVAKQEDIGLDVLVHGEFERTDMVEYFGEKMQGFAFTENAWVQSYGSRCVKPPILFGDVSRPQAMTVEWTHYAQTLTSKPMKGMLTGPVTILQWSFVRDDQPRSETCKQIALALRQEVSDLEAAGIPMIQVDEPAIREGLPLRRKDWQPYLDWAVESFRIATSGIRDDTQIHTHMCYSEFGDILPAIAKMDADVLSIETSRSKMELLADFGRFKYPNEIGPGVYDIHSPRLPTQDEMEDLLICATEFIPAARLWVNPDCGLKTRGWPEVEAALRRMVQGAQSLRA